MSDIEIKGYCDQRFAPVQRAFQANFTDRTEVGACVAVSLEGETVVDLWAGWRNKEKTLPWEQDTIVNVYSTTKTMAALTALFLADRGELDLNAPVAKYWPEYACNGKEHTKVSHFLSHSAGLSGMDEPCTGTELADWDRVITALAEQTPWWEPGSKSGYHALTQGFLIGEVVRRATGRTLAEIFRTELAEPLGADFHIGTGKEHYDRIAELIPPKTPPREAANPDTIAGRTFANPSIRVSDTLTDAWRQAEISAANGHGNARSVMRIQTLMANEGTAWGKRLMSPEGCRRVFEEQSNGPDLVLGIPVRFGMGYGLKSSSMPLGSDNSCFWGGYGGSLVLVDADARLCVSYVMNHMEADLLGDPRGGTLAATALQCLN